jgi:predicted nucleotidyltransferase
METMMADDLKNRGGRDRQRIDVNQDYELRDWSDKFGVSKEELKEAVKAVGDDASKVEQHLKERGGRSGSERG